MTRNAKSNLRYRATTTTAAIALVAGGYLVVSGATAEQAAAERSSQARKEDKLRQAAFRPDPRYDAEYNAREGRSTSTARRARSSRRARRLSWVASDTASGAYDESSTLLGRLNPLLPGLAVYGDWRTAVAY